MFVPELMNVPPDLIHNLYKNRRIVGLNLDYPLPIVDHKSERIIAMRFYTFDKKLVNSRMA